MNDAIALLAADSAPAGCDRWSFGCECGATDCAEWVDLELAEYVELRADADRRVLAAGHVAPSPSQRARRKAKQAIESAVALRAQARLQQQRAQRLLGRNVVKPLKPPEADARRPLTRILDVLQDERYVLTRLTHDDRVFEVLVELDELQFAIIEALASFESERATG
jgi:hypothetical protein